MGVAPSRRAQDEPEWRLVVLEVAGWRAPERPRSPAFGFARAGTARR